MSSYNFLKVLGGANLSITNAAPSVLILPVQRMGPWKSLMSEGVRHMSPSGSHSVKKGLQALPN